MRSVLDYLPPRSLPRRVGNAACLGGARQHPHFDRQEHPALCRSWSTARRAISGRFRPEGPTWAPPNGSFKVNRMDADHLSQEWDDAPMPSSIFFDLHGHAIHGFFDVKHLGLAVSHGCVRLSPDHGATLFAVVKAEGMAQHLGDGRRPTRRRRGTWRWCSGSRRRPSEEIGSRCRTDADRAEATAGNRSRTTANRSTRSRAYGQPVGQAYYRQRLLRAVHYGPPAYRQC